jgi:hypothetical protein
MYFVESFYFSAISIICNMSWMQSYACPKHLKEFKIISVNSSSWNSEVLEMPQPNM